MKLKDVPVAPAYLVFHDAFDNGAMEVWPYQSIELAQAEASNQNERIEGSGESDCGGYKAHTKLPRVRVWKYHPAPKELVTA